MIIPFSKWLITSIYKPFRPFGSGTTPVRGLTITMVINHLLSGVILQVESPILELDCLGAKGPECAPTFNHKARHLQKQDQKKVPES